MNPPLAKTLLKHKYLTVSSKLSPYPVSSRITTGRLLFGVVLRTTSGLTYVTAIEIQDCNDTRLPRTCSAYNHLCHTSCCVSYGVDDIRYWPAQGPARRCLASDLVAISFRDTGKAAGHTETDKNTDPISSARQCTYTADGHSISSSSCMPNPRVFCSTLVHSSAFFPS